LPARYRLAVERVNAIDLAAVRDRSDENFGANVARQRLLLAGAGAVEGRTMTFSFLKLHVASGVGWLEYNRPPVNAFHWEMVDELVPAFDLLHGDPEVRVIVVASALDRYFSSGADLNVFATITPERMYEWVTRCHVFVRRLRQSDKPLLAAIHGTAVGGGLEMTLHCDQRIAARGARLGQPEIAIGMIPPVGATQALARLLGRAAAIRYLWDGRLLEASEALALGLVDEVVPDDQLRAHVGAYAAELAGKPAPALAAIRRTITEGGGVSFEEGLAIERDWTARLAGTVEFRDGVRAFLDRRKPR
jgi:enoyl-CoA hydratase/carnithine racemase